MNQIEKIAEQETKICRQKEYLLTAVVIFIIVICGLIISQFASLRHDMTMTEEQLAAEKLIWLYSAFAATLVIGYSVNKILEIQLAKLWELKKSYL